MTDLEQRLREAMDTAVGGAHLTVDPMQLVRRQHNRRRARWAVAAAAVFAALVVAGSLLGPGLWRHDGTKPAVHRQHSLFPGGGRLLLRDGIGLKWLYPDGRVERIGYGFHSAEVQAGQVLAWTSTRRGIDYYTMHLDGTDKQHVLPASAKAVSAELSPDGSRLVYSRQGATDTLWWVNLSTGQMHPLGLLGSYSWQSNDVLLATSADGRSLLRVNVNTGARSTYLSVSDPQVVAAYRKGRPGVGRPDRIATDGYTGAGASRTLAVSLATANRYGEGQPAEMLLSHGRLYTFAPSTQPDLAFSWGPGGSFTLQTGLAGQPSIWRVFVGHIGSDALSKPYKLGDGTGVAINPNGTVIAMQFDDAVTFASIPSPSPCDRGVGCMHRLPRQIMGRGALQAWLPQ